MVSFDLTCVPALLPSLRHADRHIRLHATEILRAMVCREAARQPRFTLTQEFAYPAMVELLLTGLAVDIQRGNSGARGGGHCFSCRPARHGRAA